MNKSDIKSSFDTIDNTIGGFQNGDLIFLCSRPEIDKTSFALNIARNILGCNKTIAYFSLESSKELIFDRLLSMESQVPYIKILNNDLSDEETKSIEIAKDRILKYNLYIDDTTHISIEYIENTVAQSGNVDLIMIDYVQLMKRISVLDDPVEQNIILWHRLKKTAKKLDIPIICLSQLHRHYIDKNMNPSDKLNEIDSYLWQMNISDVFLQLVFDTTLPAQANNNKIACLVTGSRYYSKDGSVASGKSSLLHLNFDPEHLLFTT